MAFDIEGARKAGYSEGEIADYLGQEAGFDTAAALKSGYTPEDVISHLTAAPEQAKQPEVAAAPPAEEKSFLSSVGDNLTTLAKGVGSALNPVVARSLNIAQGPQEKKINSVLEGVKMRDVPFDAAEAERLSRKDYAEAVETREAQAKAPSLKEWREPILTDRQKFAEQNPITAGFAQSAASTLAGTLNVPAVAAGLAGEAINRQARTMGVPEVAGRVPNMPLVNDLKGISQEYASQLSRKSPGKAWDDGDFGRWMMTQLSGNSFSAAQSLGALFVPGAQASLLASMGGVAAGNAYAEGDSASAATLKGLVEVGSEMLPLHAAEKIKDIVLAIPTPVRGQVLAEAGKRMLAAGTAVTTNSMVGAIEEAAAEIGGNAIDKYISGKDKSLFEDVDRAAIVGAAFGTAFSGPAVAETLSSPKARAARELSRELQMPQTAPVETSVLEALRTGQTNGVNIDPVATTLSAAAAKRVEHERAVAEIGTAQTVDQAIEAAQRAVDVAPESTEAIAQRVREIEESQALPNTPIEQASQVAQDAVADIEVTRDGSLRVIGDTQAIAAQLEKAGVRNVIPTESGVIVGPAQAVQAQTILNQGVADGAGNGRLASPEVAQGTGTGQQVGSALDAGVLARPEGIGAGFAQRTLPQAVATPSEPTNAQPALAEPISPELLRTYSAPTPRQQTVASQLQARIRATYPTANFVAVGIPSGRAGKSMSEAADTAKRLFGIDVNYVKFDGSPLFDGVRADAFPNTIFLRADAPKPHMAILGHELLHEMRGTAPELYSEMGAALDALIKNDSQYAANLAQRYESRGGKLPAEWREELHADIVGDNFADPQFWSELSREKPDMFTRLANAVRQFLNKILLRAKPFGSDAYLRDIKAARDVVSSAVQKFSESRTKTPSFSVDAAKTQAQNEGYANQSTNRGTGTGAVDADGYRTASSIHQQLAEQLLQRVQRGYPNARFHAVDAPDGLRGQSLVAARTTGKRLFRQDVVFVQFDGPPLFNGAVSDSIPGVVFVRADTDKPHMSILGHELLHQLRKETPGLYDQLASRLQTMVENESAYASQLAARYERQGGQLPAEWREELYADIVGDNFSNPDFWEAMAKDQPGLFQRVAEAIRKFLDNVLSRAEPFATGQYLRDVTAARDAVVDAMRQFSGTQVGALTSQVDGVAMSVASSPATIRRFSEDNTNSNGQPVANENQEIRYSLSDSESWATPEESRIDRWIYELQNSRIDLARVQESIKEASRTIEEKFDARQAESLFPGRVAYRTDDFLKAEVRPLLQAMALSKVSMNELADYLHARGAEERNAQIARINPDMPDGGAGTNTQGVLMTNQAAQDYIKSLPADRVKVLDSLAAKVDTITKGTRDLLVNEGLEKREVIDAWEAAYKNYVPMFRDEAESGNPHPSGGGFSVRGGNSKRATGSTKEVTNILAHVLMQREAAITKAEKNRVGLSLYGLALTNPNLDFWATIRPGMQVSQIAADLKAMGVDPVVAEAGMQGVPTVRTVDPILDRVVDRANPMYKSLPGALTVKINGEDRVLMFNEKDPRALRMAESLKNLDGLTQIDWSVGLLSRLLPFVSPRVNVANATRWMAAVNTQYNPAFGIVNGIRDTFGGAVNLTSTPLRGKSSKVLLDAYTKAGPAIAKELASPDGQGEWAKLYRQFKEDGGQTGYREMFKDANDRSRAIENELKLLEKAGKLTPGKAATAMLNLLDGFNTTIENAVRLSAYKNALDQGMSRAASAKLARELTVEFNRKGRAGRELGPLYAFFNASVQGTARTIEAIKGPAGAKIITGGLMLGALQPLLLAMAGFDDDEIPEFIKTRAFIIPLAGTEKRFIAIPLPLGLHVIPNTGRVIAELAMNGGKDIGKRTFEAIGEVAGAFNPLGGGNIFTADGALRTVSPTITDPLIEIGFNKNFAGSQIERGERGETDVRPGFARAKESTQRSLTGQAYLGISKAINKLSGGSDYEAGLVSPTPERLNYLTQVVGGGVLREIEKTINLTDLAAHDEKVAQNKLPVIGRLFGQVDDEAVTRSRYFEASKKLDKAQAALKAAQKAGDVEAVRKMLDATPELMLGQTQDKIAQEIAKLNKVVAITIDDREKLKQLDEVRLVYMKMLNDAVRQQELQSGKTTPGQRLREYAKTKREEANSAAK